jgi:hypothetical protein
MKDHVNWWKRRSIVLGALFALGWLGFAVGEVRAGSLRMLVTESGGPTIPISDNGGLDTDPTIGVINVNTTLLNLSLVNYQFTAMGSNSNSPGAAANGSLTQSGTVQLLLGGTGSITVLASDVDYSLPTGLSRTMTFSTGATFTNTTAGNTDKNMSWFNGSNTLGANETPSPLVTLTSSATNPNTQSGDGAPTGVPLTSPYGLTNQSVITLTGGSVGALAQDGYHDSTLITSSAVPEPTSIALMLTTLPVWIFGVKRRRKASA